MIRMVKKGSNEPVYLDAGDISSVEPRGSADLVEVTTKTGRLYTVLPGYGQSAYQEADRIKKEVEEAKTLPSVDKITEAVIKRLNHREDDETFRS